MREVTANTIGKKPDTNPSDQKLLDKNDEAKALLGVLHA